MQEERLCYLEGVEGPCSQIMIGIGEVLEIDDKDDHGAGGCSDAEEAWS